MNKLNIFICENFYGEYHKLIMQEGFDDVILTPYPCMCINKAYKSNTQQLLKDSVEKGDQVIVVCSKYCDIVQMAANDSNIDIHTNNYCFNHVANEQFIQYILQKGGYIIGSGWLSNWRERLRTAGFDKQTARRFYSEFCKELVFFDAGIDKNAEENLKELSVYLELPFVIIPYELEALKAIIKSLVYKWQLQKAINTYEKTIAEVQSQCAEYSAILDLVSTIASYTNKCEAIEKLKEIFIIVFGAQQFKYWNYAKTNDSLPIDIAEFLSNKETTYILVMSENRFCIKLQYKEKLFGAIDVIGFLFPEYIEKYLNFAIEIAKVCGLVLFNIEQYEKLTDSEKELHYLSFHDSLKGLYNRTYLNEILNFKIPIKLQTVFMFDIDRLKYVNDHFGHAEGDKLIVSVSNILKKCFREVDIVARIGGDEFLAILTDCDKDMAELIKKRINEAIITNNLSVQQSHLVLSVSIGYVVNDNPTDTLESIIKKADELMYKDKMRKGSTA